MSPKMTGWFPKIRRTCSHQQDFGGCVPKKGQLQNLSFSKFTDCVKHIVHAGVTDPADFTSGLIFELDLQATTSVSLAISAKSLKKFRKPRVRLSAKYAPAVNSKLYSDIWHKMNIHVNVVYDICEPYR